MNGAKDDLDTQIQFVRHNFDNQQALIRFADAKAGALITILIFLGASATPVAKDAARQLGWSTPTQEVLTAVFVISSLAFLAAFLGMLVRVLRLIAPHRTQHTEAVAGQTLMYYEHVLLHRDNGAYYDAVRAAEKQLILRNTSDQVYELATILRGKMEQLTKARMLVAIAFVAWVVVVAASFLLLRLS